MGMSGLAGRGVLIAGTRCKFDSEFREEIEEGEKQLRIWGGKSVLLTVGNGISLDCCLLEKQPNNPTMIFFPGMADCYERQGYVNVVEESLAYQYFRCGFNVFLWNYPHVRKSVGSPSYDNVMKSSKAVLNYVIEELNIPQNKIILHGHSMGGGISLQLAASRNQNNELLYPDVHVCNDRSYSSLGNAMTTYVPWGFRSLVNKTMSFLSWSLDSFANWKPQGSTGHYWAIHHKNDEVVAHRTSMALALREDHKDEENIIEMNLENKSYWHGQFYDYDDLYQNTGHERPLFAEEWDPHTQH